MFSVIYKKIWIGLGFGLMLGSLIIVGFFGLNFGIDFTGGSLTEVTYKEALPEKAKVAEALTSLELGEVSVRESASDAGVPGYLIRTRDLSDSEREELSKIVLDLESGSEISRFTSVGPVIGEELKDKAGWAIAGVVLIIVIYVAFAFSGIGKPVGSSIYGFITILVLVHDVLVPTAVMSLLGHFAGYEVDVLFVMAVLAVLGYSVNDTIVVFDRVRENLILYRTERKIKKNEAGIVKEEVDYTLNKPFAEIVGLSVSQTMARSINTSFTTLLSLIALFFIGGEATKTFTLVLIVGVIAGTYSSVCFANPLLVAYEEYKRKKSS